MRKRIIIWVLIGLIVGLIIGVLIGMNFNINKGISGEAVNVQDKGEYSYTRAICSSEGKCIDIVVSCKDGEVERLEPVSELIDFNGLDGVKLSGDEFC